MNIHTTTTISFQMETKYSNGWYCVWLDEDVSERESTNTWPGIEWLGRQQKTCVYWMCVCCGWSTRIFGIEYNLIDLICMVDAAFCSHTAGYTGLLCWLIKLWYLFAWWLDINICCIVYAKGSSGVAHITFLWIVKNFFNSFFPSVVL